MDGLAQFGQSAAAREALKALARERLAGIRRQKALWRADLETFAREALIIRPADGAPMPFEFNSVQRKLHAELENQRAETGRVRAVILKARQMGISTYVGARFYHRMRHDGGMRTIIMAHRDDSNQALAEMVRPLPRVRPGSAGGDEGEQRRRAARAGERLGHRPSWWRAP